MSDNEKKKRVGLSQKARFEVFKRDKFACQYCGESAPNVVLQCDHIHPVAEGGTNDILNLITACAGCNSGKGARLLNDDAEISKQVDQMAELEDRRQQLEMLIQWRDSLRSAQDETINKIASVFSVGGYGCNDNGKASIRKWLRMFSAEEIISAADEAFDTYAVWDDDKITMDSWSKAFSKVPGVIRTRRHEAERPYLRRLFYIRGIVRNRTDCLLDVEFLEHAHLAGLSIDFLETEAKLNDYITHFIRPITQFLDEQGVPWLKGRPWV
ncbi:HNH endonuclease [Komagataeibacter phage phiKX1]|nr:HNH endonuclease [Komagataeibacter phage phiKX1]BCZ76111.1 HNH endonuclease [Komagataeibacter phage phiKX2]